MILVVECVDVLDDFVFIVIDKVRVKGNTYRWVSVYKKKVRVRGIEMSH
jgi:hypothetical protein